MRLPEPTVARLAAFADERDLRAMRIATGRPWRWLPGLLHMSATTFPPFVCLRAGSYDPGSPRGLALLAHEALHIQQAREMGRVMFYLRYLKGQFQCGFNHARHPMEVPAIELQRMVFAHESRSPRGPDDVVNV